jgi:DNA adenine methylase
MVVAKPKTVADQYEALWHAQSGQERTYYDWVREQFNKTHEPHFLLYLLARCVKASVRYNASGEFNQSPDNRRKGRHPASMRQEIFAISNLLQGRTKITSHDYKVVLDEVGGNDLVYLDPPYQGTSQNRDPRYYSGLSFDELVFVLDKLNQRHIMYILSYDGRTDQKQYGKKMPGSLGLICLEICAGRSTQSTLSGGQALTYESIYVSPALVQRLPASRKTMLLNRSLLKTENVYSPQQLTLGLV